jgi:ubiquinone/menaquinone biosynthesis C-methylase UbiE
MNDKLLDKFNKVEKVHWWWEGRRALLKLIIGSDTPKRILDIGCGTGETLSYLKRNYPKCSLYGIDSSAKAVRYSKKRGHRNIKQALANKLPFRDSFFDIVLFLDVLEHIKDHQKAIDEAKRVLRKGGKIIITSPGLNFIWSKHDENQGHQRRYTRSEIKQLAENAKMNIKLLSYFNFFLSLPIIIIRLLGNLKVFGHLTEYDSDLNFEIAFKPLLNGILRKIFVLEIILLKFVRYPIGISIVSVFEKK